MLFGCGRRPRYVIDRERLERLHCEGFLSPEELKRAKSLINRLEAINFRKNTLFQVIAAIVERQGTYLKSGSSLDLACFLQKELARKLSVNPSVICRAIDGRSLETPWGEEKPMKDFFVNEKKLAKTRVMVILESGGRGRSDSQVAGLLKKQYGLAVSRRTIVNYRKELGF